MKKLKVLVVGVGNMGASHAKAYHNIDGFELVGLVARTPKRRHPLALELGGVPEYDDFDTALAQSKPDAVAICTYPDTHLEFARKSLEAGAHVFVEKPLAVTVEDAEAIVALAMEKKKKVVVGYILRVHPSWKRFIGIAKTLGKPLVMRMNLNQQSSEHHWETHKQLMMSMSPIVDCGVHYVDVMCQMTESKPISVYAIGARLSDEIAADMYNYGQLQVRFEDGSVGWYEAGWGPMMSETAFFVKDVIGPNGCVSIKESETASDDIDSHTKTDRLLVHSQDRDSETGKFIKEDEWINVQDEPDHDELCELEQRYFLDAIVNDIDLRAHLTDAVNSMKIVMAADISVKENKVVFL